MAYSADLEKQERAHGALIQKLSTVIKLTNQELSCLEELQHREQTFPPFSNLVEEGEAFESAFIVSRGWALSFKTLSDGRRQILSVVLPGDFIGLYANLFEISDHSLSAITDLVVHRFEPQKIIELFRNCPRLAAAVCWATARDEAILAEQVVRLGRRSAVERMAHLFLEIHKRLQLVGLAEPESFELPLTQEIIADLMGLSVVHVNRTLRQLRLRGLVEMKDKKVYFLAKSAAEDVAEFSDEYLEQTELPDKTKSKLGRAG